MKHRRTRSTRHIDSLHLLAGYTVPLPVRHRNRLGRGIKGVWRLATPRIRLTT